MRVLNRRRWYHALLTVRSRDGLLISTVRAHNFVLNYQKAFLLRSGGSGPAARSLGYDVARLELVDEGTVPYLDSWLRTVRWGVCGASIVGLQVKHLCVEFLAAGEQLALFNPHLVHLFSLIAESVLKLADLGLMLGLDPLELLLKLVLLGQALFLELVCVASGLVGARP